MDAKCVRALVRRTIARFPELDAKCVQVLIDANRRQPMLMRFGSLVVVVEYIFLLPGKLAVSIRAQAARLFVRYLSGDEALYDEVANLKHVQDYLREADPTNWRTIFAEGTGKLEPSATDDEV